MINVVRAIIAAIVQNWICLVRVKVFLVQIRINVQCISGRPATDNAAIAGAGTTVVYIELVLVEVARPHKVIQQLSVVLRRRRGALERVHGIVEMMTFRV